MVYQSLIEDEGTQKRNILTSYANKLQSNHDKSLFLLSKSKLTQTFKRAYDLLLNIQTKALTWGLFYRKSNNDICYEQYLDSVQNRKFRLCLCKTRLSNHDLMIEKGRRMNLERNLRLCKQCNIE